MMPKRSDEPFFPAQDQPAHGAGASGVPRLFPGPAIIIATAALAVVAPWFFLGIPSGHDFEFHMFSWLEVAAQWKLGIFYPRWAALAHWGYGEARFLFYPPASWMLGAALGSLLPWKLAAGAYAWLALSGSGASMFLLARRYLSRADATFAAAFYAVNPYYLVVVYWRSAFAELLAGALLPLLVLFVLRMEHEGRRMIVPLSLVVAAAWLTNAPSAVMVNYSLALLVVVMAIWRRSFRPVAYGAAAVVLGAALAAFYVVPAAFEEPWVNIAEVLSPGVRPQDNFLFTILSDADHNRFNLLVSVVALAETVVVAAAVWLSRRWRRTQLAAWWSLAVWAGAAVLLMFPFTFVLWEHMPKLRFVQLPWRWLLCLNVALVILFTSGAKRWFSRLVLCAAMLVIVIALGRRVQPPWWDSAADVAEMRESVRSGHGYEGTDEYVPAGVDPYELKQDAPRAVVEGDEQARVQVLEWRPQSKGLRVLADKPGNLILHLFNYPAWQLEVNGHPVASKSLQVTGQISVPVARGENRVRARFVRTWDRTMGGWMSVLAALLIAGWLWMDRRRAPIRESGS